LRSLRSRPQAGQAIVLIALMLTVLIGMAAIAIDGARAYALRRDLQDAVDSAALAAADKLQQTGNYVTAEQAASSVFASNLRLYNAPSCSPAYGSPGATPWTVMCTYSDGTVLTEVAQSIGPQGGQFKISATSTLQLQFARVLTNGASPTLAATSTGNVNNLAYTPTLAALSQAGCGGAAGTAISISGGGTLGVTGDVVSNGTIAISNGSMRVAGDIYARCQSNVPGSTTACYSSGANTPCSYPDVAGATRSGFRLADPNFPPPTMIGGSQGLPNSNVLLSPGVYSALPFLNSTHCWFLSGGVYEFQSGLLNWGDFVSNELKPPDEPNVSDNTQRAASQFWNTNGVNCSGAFEVSKVSGPRSIQTGMWSFVLTSMRTDTYNGVAYMRESAPSMCNQVNLNNHFDAVQLAVSNVPGAMSYNIYASPPGNGCAGPFGLAANLAVSGPVLNTNTNPCPLFTGNGCTLGNESVTLSAELAAPFAPNAAAAPGTTGAYPPDGETAPLGGSLPNQNPARAPGSRGDRANENNCETVAAAYATCPAPITPGAVELYFPAGGCFVTGNGGDTYLFSGYQFDWVSVYEPGAGHPPANACLNVMGAAGNSAFIGLIYAPSAYIGVISPYAFEAAATGGLIANALGFAGTLPSITYSASYAPVAPASRLTN
jgi:Flp pilus assembly protein TadG